MKKGTSWPGSVPGSARSWHAAMSQHVTCMCMVSWWALAHAVLMAGVQEIEAKLQAHVYRLMRSKRGGGGLTIVLRTSRANPRQLSPIKEHDRIGRCDFFFARSRCSLFEASFSHSSSTVQTGEALSAHTLHHRHHAVVLSIPSTTPPYLAGPGRQSRWCAVRVHLSEASPLAVLDRITRRRRLVRLHHPRSVERFRCAISSRV
jgi:hypothetical protein